MRIALPAGVVRWLGAPLVTLLAGTWRIERVHPERWDAMVQGAGPRLFLLWHETLLPLVWCHRHQGAAIVVSEARDGRYLSDFAQRLGYEPIGGSSHRGRLKAMRGVVRLLQEGRLIGLTPDGPTGPRRVIKPGTLEAIQQLGGLVCTAFADARPARRLASWDRFLVPFPFARVRVAYGPVRHLATEGGTLDELIARVSADLAALEREVGWHEAQPTG